MIRLLLLHIFLFASVPGLMAQELKPGFDKNEYKDLLKILSITNKLDSVDQLDSLYKNIDFEIPAPGNYHRIYHSNEIGLENQWDLWQHNNRKLAVISIRGTTSNSISWMENFYAAMVPAEGVIKLSDNFSYNYKLALSEDAAVHIGWLIGIAFIAREVLPKIDSLSNANIHDFLITGHSQGGALAYYMTAILKVLQKDGRLNPNLRFKTYCSASPKPGNLFFAYDHEHLTRGGWSFNVVNSADWVPEVPVSVQTIDDFNETNPFAEADEIIKKQKFPRNLVLRKVYNKLSKPTFKARNNFQKYLGKKTTNLVQKQLPEFEPPEFYESNHYVRTGTTILLYAEEDYYTLFPDKSDNVFTHHYLIPYWYLINKN